MRARLRERAVNEVVSAERHGERPLTKLAGAHGGVAVVQHQRDAFAPLRPSDSPRRRDERSLELVSTSLTLGHREAEHVARQPPQRHASGVRSQVDTSCSCASGASLALRARHLLRDPFQEHLSSDPVLCRKPFGDSEREPIHRLLRVVCGTPSLEEWALIATLLLAEEEKVPQLRRQREVRVSRRAGEPASVLHRVELPLAALLDVGTDDRARAPIVHAQPTQLSEESVDALRGQAT